MLTLREKHEYEQEIAQLKSTLELERKAHALELSDFNLRLKRSISNASKLKSRHKKLKESIVKEAISRSDKARELISLRHSGALKIALSEIAKKTYLTIATVKKLSSENKKRLDAVCKSLELGV